MVSQILVRWIVIYPVDSATQHLNNRGLRLNFLHKQDIYKRWLSVSLPPPLTGFFPAHFSFHQPLSEHLEQANGQVTVHSQLVYQNLFIHSLFYTV